MRKFLLSYTIVIFCLIFSTKTFSQSIQTLEEIGLFLTDATYFSEKYITPATDVAVYQASSNWMTSPKKRKLYNVTLSLHGNMFFVPNKDRNFEIKNSDFSFFTIENNTSATVPTALGNDTHYYLIGQIDNNQVRIQTPKGVNQETIIYPYLQGSIALWKGFEVVVKYSTKVNLKRSDYQVYGFGLKHNFSQYIKYLDSKKIHLAGLFAYSKEQIGFGFLDTNTSYGNLGINEITGEVDTWQFQVSASKEWNKFELMTSIIANQSNFKYYLTGPKGEIENVLPVQYILNEKLKDIYKSKFNAMGEIAGRYQFNKIYVQSSLAFGKFVNTNLSLQYEF